MLNSSELQGAIIGCLINWPNERDTVSQLVQPSDFLSVTHRKCYEWILSADAFDMITTVHAMAGHIPADEIVSWSMAETTSAFLPRYCQELKDSANRVRLYDLATGIRSRYSAGQTCSELIEFVESTMSGLTPEKKTTTMIGAKELITETINRIEQRFENKGELAGIPYGLASLDDATNGMQRGDLIILAGRPSMGKELTNNTKVLLSNGKYKRMGDIAMGDSVASVDGRQSNVTGIYPQGVKPVYRVLFSDGRFLDAGLEHQWEVMYRDWPTARVLTTKDLIKKLTYQRYKNRLYIPYPSGDFGRDEVIDIHPYLLGVLIGDGGLTQSTVKITTSYPHIINKITPLLMGATLNKENTHGYRIATERGKPNPLLNKLREFGLIGKLSSDKFIPVQYLSASKSTRLELMRGLIDTDGTVEKHGSMTYTTTSFQLAQDVTELGRSLGAYVSMSSRFTEYTHKGEKRQGKRAYTLYISHDDYSEFVTIPHKKDNVKTKDRCKRLNIVSIERIDDAECQCITVSHPRALYLAGSYVVTHNSAFAANIFEHVTRNGYKGVFFSLEMGREQVMDRMAASVGNVRLNNIRSGRLEDAEWQRLFQGAEKILKQQMHIDDSPSLSLTDIRAKCRKLKRSSGLDLVVVDYLQLMKLPAKENRVQAIGEVSRGLKLLARELDCPVIALSQLNRSVDSRADKKPAMSDLRDSGEIEQDADVILFPFRPAAYCDKCRNREDTADHNTEQHQMKAELIIEKQRQGERNLSIPLAWIGKYQKFTEVRHG